MNCIHRTLTRHHTSLQKTASYYLVHITVASAVAYTVTGNLYAALTLSLLEPSIQAVVYFFHDKAWGRAAGRRAQTLLKTGSYYVLHMAVAALVAYAVTGNLWQALTLSLLEPTVQMAFFFLHEKLWDRRLQRRMQAHRPAPTTVI